jgi:hypothetical protein
VLAGIVRAQIGPAPRTIDLLDQHYLKLQHEMPSTLRTLELAA